MTSKKTGKGFEVKGSDKLSLFVPAFIDDYGFTPEEFRVFSRIMRRAGTQGNCYEIVPNLAKALLISERLVRRALKVLEKCGAITRTERPGKNDLYDFNTCDKWRPGSELSAIRADIVAKKKSIDRARKEAKKSQVVAETTGVENEATPSGNDRGGVSETTGVPLAETTDEGISNKLLISHKGTPIKVRRTGGVATSDQGIKSVPSAPKSESPADEKPSEKLRFFPLLERLPLPVGELNEIAELFSYIAESQNRRTLLKESEWIETLKKLDLEGLSLKGVRCLYQYGIEVKKFSFVTPKQMDWLLPEYREFVQKQQSQKAQNPKPKNQPFDPNRIKLENNPLPAGY